MLFDLFLSQGYLKILYLTDKILFKEPKGRLCEINFEVQACSIMFFKVEGLDKT